REDTRPAKAQRKFTKSDNAGAPRDDRKAEDKPWKKKKAFGDKPKFEGKKDKPFEKRGPKPTKG
ncbi:MAG TPA: ATP-dependent RNA helicase, partial [Agrobacterium sp.]|nr:ATP-dependent RNA helicase [Agrobacterium sp.]